MKFAFPAVLAFLLLTITPCFADETTTDPTQDPAPAPTGEVSRPAPAEQSPVLGTFRNTFYYLVVEADYASDTTRTVIRNKKGEVLAKVSAKFKKAMDIEGSGKLKDGRVVNFDGTVNGDIRYRFVKSDWGLGVGTCQLVPFRTIAVDRKKIPIGAVVQIDETIGMLLPDGSIHDGLWRADDIGGAIKEDRVDLFTGTGHDGKVYLTKAGITHLQPLTIRIISTPDADSCVFQRLLEYGNEYGKDYEY